MSQPNQQNIEAAVAILRDAKAAAGELLASTPEFRTSVEHTLEAQAMRLEFAVGIGRAKSETTSEERQGPRTFMGMPVPEEVSVQEQLASTEPQQTDIDKFRADVANAYAAFPGMSNRDIRNSFHEPEIRGVAKQAGLEVTMEEPAKITDAFLDEIKAAIQAKAEQGAKERQAEADAQSRIDEQAKAEQGAKETKKQVTGK